MELFGGSITGNTIGVDGSSYDSLTIGGDAKVINNTTKNLVLLGKSVISIDKSLTSNAWIGISTVTKPSANANIKIATGATKSELDYAQIFTPDTSEQKYVVTKDEKGNSVFRFEPGPIFATLVLADEINRATPKTQSSLLECMAERQITVDGVTLHRRF